jgi:hypothetical protein
VKAVTGLRVPKGASPEVVALADFTQQRILDVMTERVNTFAAFGVLTAARTMREELCGPIPKRIEGADGGAIVIEVRKFLEENEGES